MNIKQKLLAGGVGIGLLLLIVIALVLNSFSDLTSGFSGIVDRSDVGVTNAKQSLKRVVTSDQSLHKLSSEMEILANEISRSNMNVKILSKKVVELSAELDTLTANAEELLTDIPESNLLYDLEDLVSSMGDIKEIMRREALISLNSTIKELDQFSSNLNKKVVATKSVSDQLRQVKTLSENVVGANNEIQSLAKDFNESIVLSRRFITIVLIITIFLAIIFSYGIAHLITARLKEAIDTLFDIAEGEGDLTHRLNESGSDEIADLARGFNLFSSKIETMVQDMADAALQITHSVKQVSSITEETNSAIQQQQMESDMVATAIKQVAFTVQEMSSSAASAAETAKKTEQKAASGQKTVLDNRTAIQSLSLEVINASSVIHELEEESEGIGRILDAIKGIASQTNLLALNAAIEAARAAEHGRGFAVVADEVRTLAEQTQVSTEEIQNLISSLQEKARLAVSVMDSGSNQAEKSVIHADEVGSALNSITDSVNTIAQMNLDISSATGEQLQLTKEVENNIQNITIIAQTTTQGAQQTNDSLHELETQVSRLQGLVMQFKVSKRNHSG